MERLVWIQLQLQLHPPFTNSGNRIEIPYLNPKCGNTFFRRLIKRIASEYSNKARCRRKLNHAMREGVFKIELFNEITTKAVTNFGRNILIRLEKNEGAN